jgi:2,4-dienoyl-CoA reductase-like NADH-dependent reductase (Old Yellow Enzyme family)
MDHLFTPKKVGAYTLSHRVIQDGTNKRTDAYGGPIENRVRFLREALEALISVWGADRVLRSDHRYGWFRWCKR